MGMTRLLWTRNNDMKPMRGIGAAEKHEANKLDTTGARSFDKHVASASIGGELPIASGQDGQATPLRPRMKQQKCVP